MRTLIKGRQIAAGRQLAGWTVQQLADRVGAAKGTIINLENDAAQTRDATLNSIVQEFFDAGVEFIEGGVRWRNDVVTVLEGENAYSRALDDVYYTTEKKGGEVLFFCADDRATRPGEEEAEERIRANGVRFRCLIEEGNRVMRWPPKEYRQMPSAYFNHNLQIIYGDKVAQMLDGGRKVLIVHNASFATTARNAFNLLWSLMRPVPAPKGKSP